MNISAATWIDIVCLAVSVSMFEMALTGKGRTSGRGAAHYFPVTLWLRPILGFIGFVLFAFALIHFFHRLNA